MNRDRLLDANNQLDSAICKIDSLLRKYPFVSKIDVAKRARIELEIASRLLTQELKSNGSDEDSKDNSSRNDGKGNSTVSESDSQVDKPNDSVSKSNEEISQPTKQGE